MSMLGASHIKIMTIADLYYLLDSSIAGSGNKLEISRKKEPRLKVALFRMPCGHDRAFSLLLFYVRRPSPLWLYLGGPDLHKGS